MLPSRARLSRRQFSQFLENKGFFTVFNRIGTLKYIRETHLTFSVVTSSKHEKSAVIRNKLRRRLYTIVRAVDPSLTGILYASKQSYAMTSVELKQAIHELLAKTQHYTQ